MKHLKQSILGALLIFLVLGAAIAAYLWSGGYNIAADDSHTKPVYALLSSVRERSIAVRSRDIKVPDLDSQQMVANGAREYAAMCASCHLAPGMNDSDMRPGLNPQPPDFTKHALHDPAEAFWVIKHGIKMSGMPAWGTTHDDATLWSIVAFLQRMPQMSANEYQAISAGPHGKENDSGHSHSAGHGAHSGSSSHHH